MSAAVIHLHEHRMAKRVESPEDKTRRIVMRRCLDAGVPFNAAMNAANSACASVRAGFEPSSVADICVDRAIKGSLPDGPEAA